MFLQTSPKNQGEFVSGAASVYAHWLKREVTRVTMRSRDPAYSNGKGMELDNQVVLDLLAKVGKGDQTAFTTLYRSVNRRIFAFAINQLRDDSRAEEIVVDTMHEVWKHPERFNATSKFSTWVLGIARYKILNAFRANAHSFDELTEEMNETVAGDEASPLDLLAGRQREAGVRECMEKLTADHRECMHLVFFEGLSLGEIAVLQACPENTIKTRLFHARQKIKNCLRLLLKREGELGESTTPEPTT
jgi:RNA polymerase sigma-70 factor, ECF subfamily